MKKTVILLLIVLLLTSCSLLRDRTQPEIISVKPSDGSIGIDSLSLIEVAFSKEMERPITEKAFSIKKESSSIEGGIWWDRDGRILYFRPSSPLTRGSIYYCVIDRSAEDRHGNDLIKEYRSSFSLSAANGSASLTGTYPVCGASGITLSTNIILFFSKPIDMHSLPTRLTISPSIEVRFMSTNGGRTIVLDPLTEMINGTRYSVKLSSSIKDTDGTDLAQEYQFYFTVGNDAIPPSLNAVEIPSTSQLWSSSVLNSGLEKTDCILMHFSEPMRLDSIDNGISFQPLISGRFTSSSFSNVLFTPDEPFLLDQVYSLNIANSVCDMSGNRLPNPVSYSFIVDGTNSLPVQVIKISNENSPLWVQNQYISLGAGGTATNICINFSSPMQPSPTITKTGIRYLFGSGSSAVQISRFQWMNGNRTLRLDLKGLDSGNTYRLTIQGTKEGVSDTRGNYMLQDFMIDLKT